MRKAGGLWGREWKGQEKPMYKNVTMKPIGLNVNFKNLVIEL